jgi:hypothetical protein
VDGGLAPGKLGLVTKSLPKEAAMQTFEGPITRLLSGDKLSFCKILVVGTASLYVEVQAHCW